MNREEFKQLLAQHNDSMNDAKMAQFDLYLHLLVEWNQKMNLTAIIKPEDIYAKHFLDSVLPAFRLGLSSESFCDVGAGAGFPSIPIKIMYPEITVTILEPLQKRCIFLEMLVKELNLKNVTIVNARAEDYAKEYRESFDIVSARAVANLSMLSELCIPLIRKGGLFIAMKGSSGFQEAKDAEKAIERLGCKQIAAFEEMVEDHTHINLIYRKLKETPITYPRAFAKIKKNPL